MLDYLGNVLAGKTLQEVWNLHCKKMAAFGFDRLMYGYTHFKTPNSIGAIEDALVLSNHDKEYTSAFAYGGLYRDAPLMPWAIQNDGAISWRVTRDNWDNLTDKQRKVVAFNRAHGVVAGYTMGFANASPRTHGVQALTARRGLNQDDVDAIWAEHGHEIEVLCKIVHLKIITMPRDSLRPSLTPRQREVLEWVGEGKTNQDIAVILGVTPATVEKHLRIAREKLDVGTTAQAVLKAAFLNQVYLP